jgi:glycosyltransferase involved in cell wall biosynthesis
MDPALGGLSQALRNTLPALKLQGSENEVLSLDAPDASFLGKDPFSIHAVGPSKGPYAYGANLKPWLLANFHRFDVVITHGLWQHNSAGTASALKQYRRANPGKPAPRHYVMPHGMLDPYFQKAPGRRLKAIRNTVFWKLFEGPAVNSADGVLFTCAQELVLAREPFRPYKPRRELDVGMGVEAPPKPTAAMAPAFLERCPQVAGRSYLLFMSRLHEKKGVDMLIRAYVRLRNGQREGGRGRADAALPALVVAGPGLDTAYGRDLQALAAACPDDIHFPGMLGGDAKWGALYGCEAFVLPSHQENFGIAVVEAMACGRPVLISRQVNIWRECEPGGLVGDDTDAGTLELLTQWRDSTTQRRDELGAEALAAYERNFAVDRAARRMTEAIGP